MDQGNPSNEGGALFVRSRIGLTPLRAVLVMVGAVVAGVALSLILGSSPAHAADSPEQWPLDPVTSVVTTTVADASSSVGHAIPVAQQALDLVGGSLVTAIPVAEPLVTPVVSGIHTALTAVDRAVTTVTPVISGVLPVASNALASLAVQSVSSTPLFAGVPAANATGSVLIAPDPTGSGGLLPSPTLTSSTAAPAAALCAMFVTLLALAMVGARQRLVDDALPASPVFETDTSPA